MLLRFRLRNRLLQPGLSVSYPYRRRETASCTAAAYSSPEHSVVSSQNYLDKNPDNLIDESGIVIPENDE